MCPLVSLVSSTLQVLVPVRGSVLKGFAAVLTEVTLGHLKGAVSYIHVHVLWAWF